MKYDVVVIGAGISGLTAASLLAKRKLKVCVIESQYKPGGSCGIFKRDDCIFEQGAAMIYGFGEQGFAPHRFLFNCLEENIDVIKHDELYAINYEGHKIIFYDDIDKFIDELVKVFPKEKKNLKRFYDDMSDLYMKVIAEDPVFLSPDVVKKEKGLEKLKKHPLYYIKFLSYMNMNTEKLLKKYFKHKEIIKFFDKLTSTYCYTTVEETPAVLSSIMFVDNHFGGSYYPAGSTMNLIGKMEKVIEENGGDMIYGRKVTEILIENSKVSGVRLNDGITIYSDRVINSGTVWNLYDNLLKDSADKERKEWADELVPTYTSVILYAVVKKEVIPEGTLPIEMLIGSVDKIDEGEITIYIMSIDDKSLGSGEYHLVEAIGPTFRKWPVDKDNYEELESYKKMKDEEQGRVLDALQKKFPGFKENIIHVELATPCSLRKYVMKYKGATAGPKQKIGQHMLKRLHIRGDIEGLYNCGESTVMGTGTPAVTVSGISAADLVLRDLGLPEYEYKENMKQYVHLLKPPFDDAINKENEIEREAKRCQFCEEPRCEKHCPGHIKIRDINRRAACGNIYGAAKVLNKNDSCLSCESRICQKDCYRNTFDYHVEIHKINTSLLLKKQ